MKHARFAGRFCLLLPVCAALIGCGSEFNLVPVSGVVTLDGEPLAGASVNTQPIATGDSVNPGPGSWAKTDEQGRFTLELVDPAKPGAIAGDHRLTITVDGYSADPASDLPVAPSRPWPPRFTDGSLILTVPEGGTDDVRYDLLSNGKLKGE